MKKPSSSKPAVKEPQALKAVPGPKKALLNKTGICLGALILLCAIFYNKVIFGVGNFWEDLIYQEFPHRVFAHDSLSRFVFPHWNPYTFSGMPFFAAIHTGVLYVTNLILSFLPLDHGSLWYMIEFFIVLHVAISGITMFLLAREFSLSRVSSLGAAISFMFCGFFVVHIIHSLMLYILAWLPLIVLLMKRGVERDDPKLFVFAGLILGATIFAGHPQITFYEFLFLGAFAIYLITFISKRKVVHSTFIIAAFAIAVGLSAIQLFPAAELSKESARTVWTYQMASEGSMSFRQLFTFIVPKLFGGTNSQNPWRPELAFWLNDSFHSGYWTFWETTFYTGIAILILGLVQFVNIKRSRFVLFCAIWFVFSLMVALGNHFPVYELLFKYVPGFGGFRIPARILVTWDLLLPLMAARTIDELRDPEARRRYKVPLIAMAGVCLAFGLAVAGKFVVNFWIEFANDTYMNYAVNQAAIMLGMLCAGVLVTVLLYRSTISHRTFKISIAGVIALDLFVFGMNYHIVPYNAQEYFSRNRDLADFLQKESASEIFRTNMREGGTMLLERNQGMIDKIQLIEGYNPLNLYLHNVPTTPGRQLDLLNVKFKVAVDKTSGEVSMVNNATMLPRAKMFYRAIVCDNDSGVKQVLMSDTFAEQKEVVLTRAPGLSLPSRTPDSIANSVTIDRYEDNRIDLRVNSAENGILWLSEIWYPAWKATIDGKPATIMRADFSFRALEMPLGEHVVVMKFDSAAFKKGLLLTLFTILASVAVLVILGRSYNPAGLRKSVS